ncbi:hypothetical protein K440DRAFT_38758 [Wilcoxina mikolae CBS 423.85]|nr:hypothetical protein K440DRAFT_38758 [Wilcoxina mikolae CBS 423.85]
MCMWDLGSLPGFDRVDTAPMKYADSTLNWNTLSSHRPPQHDRTEEIEPSVCLARGHKEVSITGVSSPTTRIMTKEKFDSPPLPPLRPSTARASIPFNRPTNPRRTNNRLPPRLLIKHLSPISPLLLLFQDLQNPPHTHTALRPPSPL